MFRRVSAILGFTEMIFNKGFWQMNPRLIRTENQLLVLIVESAMIQQITSLPS